MTYIIGVDGGGTKTSLKAFTLSGAFVRAAITASTNYNFVGTEHAVDNLISGIASLCLENDVLAIAFGDSSLDESGINEKTETFRMLLRQKLKGKTHIFIRSDAYMSLYGHTRGSEGVMMISGTGAMGLACDKTGAMHTVGGWGRLTGDEGSGYHIALSGIQAALQDYDGIGERTALTCLLPQFFGCNKMRDLINVFYGSPQTDIAAFAEVVAKEALLGDKVSQKILQRTSLYLADYTKQLIGRLYQANSQYENKTVGVYGSVLTKNKFIRCEYESLLRQLYPEIKVLVPSLDPEDAAAMYVRDTYLEAITR